MITMATFQLCPFCALFRISKKKKNVVFVIHVLPHHSFVLFIAFLKKKEVHKYAKILLYLKNKDYKTTEKQSNESENRFHCVFVGTILDKTETRKLFSSPYSLLYLLKSHFRFVIKTLRLTWAVKSGDKRPFKLKKNTNVKRTFSTYHLAD